jgi:hypothetical protein
MRRGQGTSSERKKEIEKEGKKEREGEDKRAMRVHVIGVDEVLNALAR